MVLLSTRNIFLVEIYINSKLAMLSESVLITLCMEMVSSFWFDTSNLGKSIVHIEGCQVILLSEDLFNFYKYF